MDEFLKELARFGDVTDTFTAFDEAMVLGLSFVLSLIVAWTYQFTHRGISYSQSFARDFRERILRIEFPVGKDPDTLLSPLLETFADDASLVSVETVKAGEVQELVYSIQMKRKALPHVLLAELRKVNGDRKVTRVTGFQDMDL